MMELVAEIAVMSAQIKGIKDEAFSSEKAHKSVWIRPDGTTPEKRKNLRYFELRDAGYDLERVEYEKVTSHIRPSHESWERYVRLKMEISIRLAALHVARGSRSKALYHAPKGAAGEEFFNKAARMTESEENHA